MGSMHEYYITGSDLKYQKILILILSIGGAYAISHFFNWISELTSWNFWWIEIPSILGVYALIDKKIDKKYWAKFYKIPSLEGSWKGYLKSSYDNYTEEYPINCIIKQNSKIISIVLETEKSISYSVSANMDLNKINGVTLKYDYINIPKIEQNDLLNVHFGTNTFKMNGNKLEGEYYNKQRDTSGKIILEKVEE